jgi:hypothetical protein
VALAPKAGELFVPSLELALEDLHAQLEVAQRSDLLDRSSQPVLELAARHAQAADLPFQGFDGSTVERRSLPSASRLLRP